MPSQRIIECSLGRQTFELRVAPLSWGGPHVLPRAVMIPPERLSSHSQRNHFRLPAIISSCVKRLWWNEPGSVFGCAPPGTSRDEYGYSSASVPSEWPSSWSEISGPCGLPPEVVACVPPMPPYVNVFASASVCTFAPETPSGAR